MPIQLTDAGITTQTAAEIKAEFFTKLKDPTVGFGPDFVTDEREAVPRMFAIIAEAAAKAQSLTKSVTSVLKPGEARGVYADSMAAITGTTRRGDTYSTVAGTFTGVAAANIPTGRVVRHNPSNTLWSSTVDVVLGGGGTGAVTLKANTPGPIEIVASTDWTIVSGDVNLTDFESTADSSPGELRETDEELEAKRKAELGGLGSTTQRAIRANLTQHFTDLGYEVDSIAVYVNFTAFTDADGRPPHSVEVLLDDNNLIPDAVIAAAIWDLAVGGGIQPFGTTVVTHVDEAGENQEVGFSRAVGVNMWVRATVLRTGAEVATGDETALAQTIETGLATFGSASHPAGRDVIPVAFVSSVTSRLPHGSFLAVTIEVSDDGATWQTTPYAIDARSEARFAVARCDVLFT